MNTNLVAIALNVLLYIAPVAALQFVVYEVYSKTGRMRNFYYLLLYLLPLVAMILSLNSVTSMFSVEPYIVEALYYLFYGVLVLYTIVLLQKLLPLRKYGKFLQRISTKSALLCILITTAPFVLIALAPPSRRLNIALYWSISMVFVGASVCIACIERKLINLSATATSLLYASFVTKLFSVMYFNSAHASSVISPILGVTGALIAIYEGYLFAIKNIETARYVDVVHRWHKVAMKVAAVIMIVVSLLMTANVLFSVEGIYQYRNGKILYITNNLQESSREAAKKTDKFLNKSLKFLKKASIDNDLYCSLEVKEKTIKDLYEISKDMYFSSLALFDANGNLLFAYPGAYTPSERERLIHYAKKVASIHIPKVSKPFIDNTGFTAIAIYYPIFNEDKFVGSLAGIISGTRLGAIVSEKVASNPLKPFVELSARGKLMYGTDPEYPILSKTKILRHSDRKEKVFYGLNSFKFLGKTFFVETHIGQKSVYNEIHRFEKKRVLVLLLRIIALFLVLYLSVWLIHILDGKLGAATEAAVLTMRKEKERSDDLSKRLFTLSEFLKDISLTKDEAAFYDELLKIAIKIIPNAQKGSVGIKKGDWLYFVSAYGYDLEHLRKLKISFEKEKSIIKGNEVHTFNHIDKTDRDYFTEEGIALMKKIGNYGIKSTLIAPLYVDGDYIGSIFLDNFDREDAFTEEDKKIATALSNIASTFTEARRDINEIKNNLTINLALTEIAESIAKDKDKKNDVLSVVLRVLRETISKDICYFAVVIPLNDRIVMHYSDTEQHGVVKVEKELHIPEKPVLVNPEELKFTKVCSGTKKVLVVPYEHAKDKVLLYGFSTDNIDENTLTMLKNLSDHLYNLLTNIHLHKELESLYTELLISLVNSIDLKDPYTKFHSERVTTYAYLIGKELNLPRKKLVTLFYASLLHDIGKIWSPDEALKKPGKLTEKEFEEIKKHPEVGASMIDHMEFLSESSRVLRHHHEHYDGSGYPDGLKGEDIPLLSRIIAVADAFDAMTSDRPYRKGMTIEEALSIIEEESGKQFDPEIASVFVKFVREHRDVIEKIMKNPDAIAIYKKLSEEE